MFFLYCWDSRVLTAPPHIYYIGLLHATRVLPHDPLTVNILYLDCSLLYKHVLLILATADIYFGILFAYNLKYLFNLYINLCDQNFEIWQRVWTDCELDKEAWVTTPSQHRSTWPLGYIHVWVCDHLVTYTCEWVDIPVYSNSREYLHTISLHNYNNSLMRS